MEGTLSLKTYGTFENRFMDIARYLRLIKVLLQDLNYFVDVEMTS